MNSMEFSNWEDYMKGKRKSSWWKRVNWHKVALYMVVIFFVYDFLYCIFIYSYVGKLNSDQELRLQEYRKNSTFSTVYYSMHRFLGDPSLQEKDEADWKENGKM